VTHSELVAGDFDGDHKFDVGIVTDQVINYMAYTPEILSVGRSFVGVYERRKYANGSTSGDWWNAQCGTDCFVFNALGAN
jgi:hypothetical protein